MSLCLNYGINITAEKSTAYHHFTRAPRTPAASALTSARMASIRLGLAVLSGLRLSARRWTRAVPTTAASAARATCGGLLRSSEAEADGDRQSGEAAQPGDGGGDLGGIGRAGAGDAGDRDVIDEAAGVLDDAREAVLVARRGREADKIEARGARRPGQLGILLGRQVDDDNPVDPGGNGVLREALRSVAVDRVVIPHQHDRGRLVGAAQLADERQSAPQRHARFQGPLPGLLDYRAVRHRIGERHANLDQICAGRWKAAEQPDGGLGIGIACGQIGYQPGASLLAQRGKTLLDAAHDRTTLNVRKVKSREPQSSWPDLFRPSPSRLEHSLWMTGSSPVMTMRSRLTV